jgi:hypothetical protein
MKVSQILTDVRRELLESNADASFWTDSELIRLINRGQFDYVNRTRILEDDALLSLQVGRSDYPLPSNWVSSKAIFHFKTEDGITSQRRLVASDLERMSIEVPEFLDDTTDRRARPSRYWIWGTEIHVHPAPDTIQDSDLRLYYKSKPRRVSDPTDDIEVPEELSDAINAYVLWKAWTKENENQRATDQAAIYLSYIGQGLRYVKRKTGDRQGKIDTGSPRAFSGAGDPGFNPFNV